MLIDVKICVITIDKEGNMINISPYQSALMSILETIKLVIHVQFYSYVECILLLSSSLSYIMAV